ncbi:uncharacterized protein F5891DRAFT_1051540, partial [Suillus fuscotomentosus]
KVALLLRLQLELVLGNSECARIAGSFMDAWPPNDIDDFYHRSLGRKQLQSPSVEAYGNGVKRRELAISTELAVSSVHRLYTDVEAIIEHRPQGCRHPARASQTSLKLDVTNASQAIVFVDTI